MKNIVGKIWPMIYVLALAAFVFSSCASRENMSPNYGERTKAFFAAQHVHSEAAKGSPAGLDSEEAYIIHASYKKGIGGKKGKIKETGAQVLVLKEGKKKQ